MMYRRKFSYKREGKSVKFYISIVPMQSWDASDIAVNLTRVMAVRTTETSSSAATTLSLQYHVLRILPLSKELRVGIPEHKQLIVHKTKSSARNSLSLLHEKLLHLQSCPK